VTAFRTSDFSSIVLKLRIDICGRIVVMARKIVVTSGKGGVGKTTVCASLGIALAERGLRVLLIDGDVGLNNLDVLMGIEHKIAYDMADVLEGKCRIRQALIEHHDHSTLYILPSAHAYASEDIGVKNFRQLIQRLDSGFDFILIDCPAGIEGGFHRAVLPADEAIIVTTPHVPSIRDADKVLTILKSYDLPQIHMLVNRVRGDLLLSGEMMDAYQIGKVLRLAPIGIVPEDDAITIYSQLGKLSSHQSLSRIAYAMIAENLVSGRRKLFDCTAQFKGFFGKIKMKLRRDGI
jgi:septum site-determining protein MinD